MSLERRALDRIGREFPADCHARVAELLYRYIGPERNRVIWDILQLSEGDLEKLTHYAEVAQKDYRDILYWAEYFANDPMFKDQSPKEMVEKILAKWGNRGRGD